MTDEDIDARKKQMKADALLYQTAYECLGQSFPTVAHRDTQVRETKSVLQTFVRASASGLSWSVRLSVLQGMKAVMSKVSLVPQTSNGENSAVILSADVLTECVESVCGISGIGDMKSAVVRVGGIDALNALLSRDTAQLNALLSDTADAAAMGRILVAVNFAMNDNEGTVVHAASRLKASLNKLHISNNV